jgi:hypothetical protein
MTFQRYRERSRDVQDGTERHVWGEQEYTDAGSIIKVRGTDTDDEEATVLNIGGVSFNIKKDSDAEVFLLASSSDTNLKMAVLTIPRDKQRRWKEGDGGVQHPTDPEFALDFSDKLAHITKNLFGVGEKGEFEVKGKEAYFRVEKLIVDGELIVNKRIKTPEVISGKEPPPSFQGNKQAEKKSSGSSSSGGGGSSASVATASFGEQGELDFG